MEQSSKEVEALLKQAEKLKKKAEEEACVLFACRHGLGGGGGRVGSPDHNMATMHMRVQRQAVACCLGGDLPCAAPSPLRRLLTFISTS
jgi:hypothetical protein